MMNKLVSKTVKKGGIFGGIIAAVVVLTIIFCAIFGINYDMPLDKAKTLTVQMNTFFYDNKVDELKDLCEDEFAALHLDVEYMYDGKMAGDTCEIVYVFQDSEAVDTKLEDAKVAIVQKIEDKKADTTADWGGSFFQVTSNTEKPSGFPVGRVAKGIIVAVSLCIVVGVYVAIRYGLYKGIVAMLAPLVSMVFTTSVILLTRIPVSMGVFYAVALSGLISTTFTVLTLSKMRSADENLKGEDLVVSSVPCKLIGTFSTVLGAAILLVGIIATWQVRWVALCAIIALDLAVYVALHIVPAMLLFVQNSADKKAAETTASGYVGAKKAEDQE